LARNRVIFKNTLPLPSSVVSHAMGQMGNILNSRRIKVEKVEKLEKGEELWMTKLNVKILISPKISQRSNWQLQVSPQEFKSWLTSQSGYTLCFDGASKGNPWEAV
jgi:hypothetical protein